MGERRSFSEVILVHGSTQMQRSRGHDDPGSIDAKGRDQTREMNDKDAPDLSPPTLALCLHVDLRGKDSLCSTHLLLSWSFGDLPSTCSVLGISLWSTLPRSPNPGKKGCSFPILQTRTQRIRKVGLHITGLQGLTWPTCFPLHHSICPSILTGNH